MKKRTTRALCLLLAVVFICGMPIPASASRFTDVPAGAWYASAVEDMVNRGVIKGRSDTVFDPDGGLSRAEFVAMLARCVLSEGELDEYNYASQFRDVSRSGWANKYINWAAEIGIVKGVNSKTFAPGQLVSRQDMATIVSRFAKATGQVLPATEGPIMFLDNRSIAGYASPCVTACQRAGIIKGFDDLTFRPNASATRKEAVTIVSRYLSYSRSAGYKIIRKRMNGIAISAVEFDPQTFSAGVAMGSNRARGAEQMQSFVNRLSPKIAVNAAFYDMSNFDTYGTIITGGRWVTLYNDFSPAKSAIVMDSRGNFSVENFYARVYADVTATNGTRQSAHTLGVNRMPYTAQDGTRLIFTKDWGSSLGFTAGFAAVVNANGKVTAVYRNQDVSIPQNGYVLALRAPRQDAFEGAVTVGAQIDLSISYEGSSTQDIELAIGAGPKIVNNGQVYGNASTYRAEGFGTADMTSRVPRVCIGVRNDGKLVILTAEASVEQLSRIMVVMGCRSAINLDGGGSTNLYVDGQWLAGPTSRYLNNVLYFK